MLKIPFLLLLLFLLFATLFQLNAQGYFAERISYKGFTFDCIRLNTDSVDVEFFWKDDKGRIYKSLEGVRTEVKRNNKQLIMLTNGGMYLENNHPQGLYIENGSELTPIVTANNSYGNFYMKPNGVFLIDTTGAKVIETSKFLAINDSIVFATQSGPMLVIDGKIHSAFKENSTNTYIRSGVGIISEKEIVFVISNQKVNFYTFASLFKETWNCKNALYLDGAISKMYLPKLKRFDNGGSFGCMIGIVSG